MSLLSNLFVKIHSVFQNSTFPQSLCQGRIHIFYSLWLSKREGKWAWSLLTNSRSQFCFLSYSFNISRPKSHYGVKHWSFECEYQSFSTSASPCISLNFQSALLPPPTTATFASRSLCLTYLLQYWLSIIHIDGKLCTLISKLFD